MSNTSFTVKELKERFDDGELDLSLSTLTEDDIPIKQMKQLKKLTGLDLSCNVMTLIPKEIIEFTQLVKLDLSKNLLTCLPANIGDLTKLQHLDLLGNRLTTLPESFGDLSSLRWLDVKDNPLSAGIKKEAGDCLDDKQCKICAIRVVKLMDYVHKEREKIRTEERAKQEAESQRLAEQDRIAKKQKKQEEKEKKRQEFLSQRQEVLDNTTLTPKNTGDSVPLSVTNNLSVGDVQEKLVKKAISSNTSDSSSGLCADMLSGIAIILMTFSVTLSIICAFFYYCENTKEDIPACNSKVGVATRSYIDNTVLPLVENIIQKAQHFINNLKK